MSDMIDSSNKGKTVSFKVICSLVFNIFLHQHAHNEAFCVTKCHIYCDWLLHLCPQSFTDWSVATYFVCSTYEIVL